MNRLIKLVAVLSTFGISAFAAHTATGFELGKGAPCYYYTHSWSCTTANLRTEEVAFKTAEITKPTVAPAVINAVPTETTQSSYVPKEVFFDTNKTAPTAKSKHELDGLAQWMKQNTFAKVQIDGYADQSGKAAHNQELSKRRAQNVKKYLVSRGISAKRISATAHGDTVPERKVTISVNQ